MGVWGRCHRGSEFFEVDLRLPPFELTNFLHFYDEHTEHRKGMLLYDLKTLRKANWKAIRARAAEL